MQDKTWYSILGLDAEPLFLQDDMLNQRIHLNTLKKSKMLYDRGPLFEAT